MAGARGKFGILKLILIYFVRDFWGLLLIFERAILLVTSGVFFEKFFYSGIFSTLLSNSFLTIATLSLM